MLTSAAVVHVLTRGRHKHAIAYLGIIAIVMTFQIVTSERRAVFRLRDLERRYRDTGEYIARRLPANAVVITTQQSGSVRFYSGRQTIVWDVLGPEWLDPAVDFLQSKGLHPYFLFEMTEDSQFKQRFDGKSHWGALGWPPMAQIGRDVKLYDALDYERFSRGERIETEFVWEKVERIGDSWFSSENSRIGELGNWSPESLNPQISNSPIESQFLRSNTFNVSVPPSRIPISST